MRGWELIKNETLSQADLYMDHCTLYIMFSSSSPMLSASNFYKRNENPKRLSVQQLSLQVITTYQVFSSLWHAICMLN